MPKVDVHKTASILA